MFECDSEGDMNHISLFSGIGGIDIAAHWAGFKTVAFVERDKFCQKVLAKNWPGVPIHDDVKTFNRSSVNGPVRVISGGFPCQPYSVAGERLGAEDDRALWPENLRIVEEFRPSWFVGENVIGIIGLALDNVLASLESIGYAARTFDIPASAVGAYHERRRVFIVAHSDSNRSQGGQESRGGEEGGAWREERTQGLYAPGVRLENPDPKLFRDINGIPGRSHRSKALGNAVVPQQIYPIFKAIADIERAI